MYTPRFRSRVSGSLAALVLLVGCESGDAPAADGTPAAATSLGGDPAALLSTDPVDQINALLNRVIMPIPGEPIDTRFQVHLLEGDSIVVDFDQREGGGDWITAARAVSALAGLGTERRRERGLDFVCGSENCFEYRAPMDQLNVARLPEGPDRDWFTELLRDLGTGATSLDAAGGPEAINQRLRTSAIRYSEIVTSWYQTSFVEDWAYIETWQHTEGFPEQNMRGWRAVHLPGLGVPDGSDVVPCSEPGCVLDVDTTPLRFILESPEDAERMATLLEGLFNVEG